MKKRVGIWFLPSVLLIWLIAILINFNNFLMGSPADAFNITATGVYIMLVTAGCFFQWAKKQGYSLLSGVEQPLLLR